MKPRSDESKIVDAKQRVIVLLLLEKGTKEYCDNLDVQVIKENKEFWKIIKLFFSDKSKSRNIMTF